MLFLGSGASKAVGIGDLEDLTNLIIEQTDGNLKEKIESIQDLVDSNRERYNFQFNLEILYSIFEGIANKRSFLNELGPYPILMDTLLLDNRTYNELVVTNIELASFKEITHNTIVNTITQYEKNNERRNLARKLYDELFRIPLNYSDRFQNARGGQVFNAFNVVATLNYDQVLELYDNDTSGESPTKPNFLTERGFDNKGHPRLYKLKLREILLGEKEIQYIKLHGSTDWWIDDNNNIVQSFHQDNPLAKFKERQIIYPIYEKYISKDPFFTLYQYFRRRLLKEDIVIVIGYSFADISINNAFIDWLSYNNSARLIIVARKNRHNIIRNSLLIHSNRIEFLNDYFGETNFILNLTNLLIRE